MDVIDRAFEDMIIEANKQDVTITYTKKGIEANLVAKGSPTAILIALAGLENRILNSVGANQEEFKLIKKIVDVKEVD